jgi:hypothetical protein
MADPYNLTKRGKFWVPDFTLHWAAAQAKTVQNRARTTLEYTA